MADPDIRVRCIQLQNRLISRGLSLKQARVVMEDLIPILRPADAVVTVMETIDHRGEPENYRAAWKRITG